MLGAIIGDIVGSAHERGKNKLEKSKVKNPMDFPLFTEASEFTDDSLLTIATMQCMLTGMSYADSYRMYANKYPDSGFGGMFVSWFLSQTAGPYNSFGNGSAMRVSPVAYISDDIDVVLAEAKRSADVTHNHPDGVAGAQAIALAVLLARLTHSKDIIRTDIATRFGYDMYRTVAEIRPTYRFDVTCPGSVPEAIIAFLDSNNFEEAVRLAISLGGDTDTQACMAGAIAEAFYGTVSIPTSIAQEAMQRLPAELADIVTAWYGRYLPGVLPIRAGGKNG